MSTRSPKSSKTTSRAKKRVELSIVVVNYNVKEFLEQLLISLQPALKGIASEIIVVDNASTDGSQKLLREKFPGVTLLANDENVGFARASNQGLRVARGRFLALLNPDTVVQEDTFSAMLDFMKAHPEAGMVGCKILNPDGSLQLACRRSFPTPWVAFTKLSGLSRLFPRSRLFGRYNLTFLDPDRSYEVEAISGSFMMIRRQVLEDVGFLDEAFFMYGEDLDWCYRIREAGWKVCYFPGTQIIHFKGESSKKAQFDSLRTFYRAMGLFARKHFNQKYLLMPYWLLLLAIWVRAGLSFFARVVSALWVSLIDLLLLWTALGLGLLVRFGNLVHLRSFVPVFVVYSLVWMFSLSLLGSHRKKRFSSSRAGLAILMGFFVNASFTFFFKQYAFSRAVVLLGSVMGALLIPGWRLAVKLLARVRLLPFAGTLGKTLLARNTVVVGDLKSGERLIKRLNSNPDSGYNVTGLLSTNGEHLGEVRAGVEVVGTVAELNSFIRENNVQEVIFATEQVPYNQILRIIAGAADQRVNFKLMPSNLDVIIGKASIDRIDDVPLLEIDYKLHRRPYRAVKRAFDLLIATIVLILSTPFLLFRYLCRTPMEARVVQGVHGREVRLRRFRGGGLLNRVPYLVQVIRGGVSLVGTELREVRAEKATAVDLKPGLTGLVQVNRHRNLTQEDKERYHLYYLKNYSPLLDLEILFKALFRL